MLFTANIPGSFFDVISSSQNGARHTVRAIKEGNTAITAELSSKV